MSSTASARSPETRAARLFATRCDEVAPMLDEVLARPLPTFDASRAGGEVTPHRWVVTGVGASEGPARALVAALRAAGGVDAAYWPVSAFLADVAAAADTALVVFSQGLSPNSRLALARAPSFSETFLFTSWSGPLPPKLRALDVRVVTLPPPSERGALVRIVGPACATLAGLRFARALGAETDARLSAVVADVAAAEGRAREALSPAHEHLLERPIAFVSAGSAIELYRGLSNKWLETLPAPEPPVWDVLGLVHGPLQGVYEREMTFITLECASTPRERDLFERLEQTLVPGRHAMVRLTSRHPRLAALLDHDALVNRLALRALGRTPRDTSSWEGSGLDASLYELDE